MPRSADLGKRAEAVSHRGSLGQGKKGRILFVDDDRGVLNGLRRSLYSERGNWSLSFALGAKEAIELLTEERFDIIVSELKMAGMDGFSLLEYVKTRHPDTVRVVLSAYTEVGIALRTVPIAHQLLPKPCSGKVLREVFSRALLLRGLFVDSRIRKVVSSIGSLPSQPQVYLELTEALRSQNTSASQIANIISRDLAMSAKVLQIVNSAFFGLPRRIADIREAVTYLGIDHLMSLALAVHAFKPFQRKGKAAAAWLKAEQDHGVLCGSLARTIVQDKREVEIAFLAGMMHDIGKLVLASKLPQEYQKVQRLSAARHYPEYRIERELLGVTHAEIGAYLIGTWGVPFAVTEAVAYHHRPQAVKLDNNSILAAVHLANVLIYEATIGATGNSFLSPKTQGFAEQVKMANTISEWRELAREEIDRSGNIELLRSRYSWRQVKST